MRMTGGEEEKRMGWGVEGRNETMRRKGGKGKKGRNI